MVLPDIFNARDSKPGSVMIALLDAAEDTGNIAIVEGGKGFQHFGIRSIKAPGEFGIRNAIRVGAAIVGIFVAKRSTDIGADGIFSKTH